MRPNTSVGGFALLLVSALSPSAHGAVTLHPIADAYVRSGPNKENVRFGPTAILGAKRSASPSDGFHRESYLKFDLKDVNKIASGKLRLYCPDAKEFAAGTSEIRSSAATSWTDDRTVSSITWANKPAAGTAVHAVGKWALGWNEWDITAFLQAEKAAGRNLVTLIVRNTTVTTGLLAMNSRESAANKPELRIVPAPGGTTPPK